jgi:tetratricopeptide (TPR) repeat protein
VIALVATAAAFLAAALLAERFLRKGRTQSSWGRLLAVNAVAAALWAGLGRSTGLADPLEVALFWGGALLLWVGVRAHIESSILLTLAQALSESGSLSRGELRALVDARSGALRLRELERGGFVRRAGDALALLPRGHAAVWIHRLLTAAWSRSASAAPGGRPGLGLPYAPHVSRPLGSNLAVPMLAGALVLATLVVFAPSLDNGFVTFDDDVEILTSVGPRLGLSAAGLRWALTSIPWQNWCPLTGVSLLASYELFGFDPRGWHATDLLLHATSVLLLFLALARMTKDVGRSAFVAALFALHPLRVESVAWASERRDVLSTAFSMLTILLYARYAELPASRGRYAAMTGAYALALLAKPMAVTLPFALLLLDVWPLRRIALDAGRGPLRAAAWRCAREKLPLLALAGAIAAVTVLAQYLGRGLQSIDALPPAVRIANAMTSWVAYVQRFVWPADLMFYYPFEPATLTPGRVALASGVVLVAVVAALIALRRRPPLGVGLLWYLGTLVPVIGLVQVGSQASADRYTYLPSVGLAIAVAWSVQAAWTRSRAGRAIVAALALLWLGTLAMLTQRQIGVWKDGPTLFGAALRIQPDHPMAHYHMGRWLIESGRFEEARQHLAQAAPRMPRSGEAQANLGVALLGLGRAAEAVPHMQRAAEIDPSSAETHAQLARALIEAGRTGEAEAPARRAMALAPELPLSPLLLGVALESAGRGVEAREAYAQAASVARDALARRQGREPQARAVLAQAEQSLRRLAAEGAGS